LNASPIWPEVGSHVENYRGAYSLRAAKNSAMWHKSGVFSEINLAESVTPKTNLTRQSNSSSVGDCNEASHWHDD